MRINEFIFEGITHLEDLPVEQFISSLRRLNEFEISEKIDGNNLHFGIDDAGKFFTSREGKSGSKYYDYTNWGNKFKDTGFKSAHLALEKITVKLKSKKLLLPGEQIEVEILYGTLPNTVPYKGGVNQIILLRPITSPEGIENLTERLNVIKKVLEGIKITVSVSEIPYTEDGKTINYKTEKHVWTVSQTPKIDKSILSKSNLKSKLEVSLGKLEDYLYENSGIGSFSNIEILSLPLNKKPENVDKSMWSRLLPMVKTKKAKVIERVKHFKLDIKEELLNKLVRNVASEFGPSVEEGGWVEGLVFRDPKTNELFKLIDKDVFTSINKFNWQIRNIIKSSKISSKISDVNGRIINQMAAVINVPELGKIMTVKRYLKNLKNEGLNPIEKIAKGFDYKEVKPRWVEIITHHIKLLDRIFSWYEENKDKLVFKTSGETPKTSSYSGGVDERTRQAFAEMKNDYTQLLSDIKSAKSSEELVELFIGEKLKTLDESRVITEGGHAFENVGAIHRSEIKPTLMYLAEILGLSYSELEKYTLGSVNKSEFSGDMDIALQEFSPEEQASFVKKIENKIGKENVKKIALIVSLKLPIQEYNSELNTNRPRTGYVQVDLMFGDRDWNKFYYHSAGDASKFKGVHRNLMIAAIVKNMVEFESKELDAYGRPVETIRFIFSPTNGLIKIKRTSKKNKKGEWIRGQDTEYLSKPIKSPEMITKMIFGKNASVGVFQSLETLVQAVKKYLPDQADKIFRNFMSGMQNEQSSFEFPEELEKYRN